MFRWERQQSDDEAARQLILTYNHLDESYGQVARTRSLHLILPSSLITQLHLLFAHNVH